MVKKNLSVHYMTKKEDVYKKFFNISYGLKMPIIFDGAYINGDFFEKYLNLILKLKTVISGAKIFSVNNLFYNIEYITYICLGHGISYLKDFLYKDYYSYKYTIKFYYLLLEYLFQMQKNMDGKIIIL